MIAQAKARFVALFSRLASPRHSSGDVRGSGASSHRPAFLAIPFTTALIALALAAMALAASAAAAAETKAKLGEFCTTGSGAGQCENPNGVAVDQSNGNVYVVDQANNRIDEFSVIGNFIRSFGKDVVLGAFV